MKKLFVLVALLLSLPSQAFVRATTSAGAEMWWPSPVRPVFYTNWKNASGLSYSQVFDSFTHALSRWKYATGAPAIDFDYWQGSNSATPVVRGYDNRNAVFFSSQSSMKLGASTLALTATTFYANGQILEADVEFNDESANFTTNPSDTSAFGSSNVFLESVATHEFGHAFGLNHSANLQSTMMYTEFRGQSKLSCDDVAGVHTMYPNTGYTSQLGSISGTIKLGATQIFGAQVEAIEIARGAVASSTITRSDGTFTISNLSPGAYTILVSPFQGSAPLSSLCGGSAVDCSYGTVNSNTVCSGSPFKRRFLETSTGVPSSIQVSASADAAVGEIQTSCSAMPGGTAALSISAADSAGAVLSGAGPSRAVRDTIIGGTNSQQFFKLSGVSGHIVARALSYSLYAPFDATVTIVNSAGNAVSGVTSTADVFTNSSLYVNRDSRATLDLATATDVYVRVTNSAAVSSLNFPGGGSSIVDTARFLLTTITVNDSATVATPANERCEAADSFPPFADQGPPPDIAPSVPSTPTAAAPSGGGGGGGGSTSSGGGCGMMVDSQHSGGPGKGALFSLWSIALMLMAGRVLVSRAARR